MPVMVEKGELKGRERENEYTIAIVNLFPLQDISTRAGAGVEFIIPRSFH